MHAAPVRCVATAGNNYATCTRPAVPNAPDSAESLLPARSGCSATRTRNDNPRRAELRHRLLQMIVRNEAQRRVQFHSIGA